MKEKKVQLKQAQKNIAGLVLEHVVAQAKLKDRYNEIRIASRYQSSQSPGYNDWYVTAGIIVRTTSDNTLTKQEIKVNPNTYTRK